MTEKLTFYRRLKPEDITYIFDFAEVDLIIVDQEFESLLDDFHKTHPDVPFLVDLVCNFYTYTRLSLNSSSGRPVTNVQVQDTDGTEGPFNEAIRDGLEYDRTHGSRGWAGLKSQCASEDDMLAIPFTSGTTSKPKGCVYTHRGAYLAALGNIVESGLNPPKGRCKYLWTLPM